MGEQLSALWTTAQQVQAKKRLITITEAHFPGYSYPSDNAKILRYIKEKCDGKDRCDIETTDSNLNNISSIFDKISLTYYCGIDKMPAVTEAKGPVLILSCPPLG
jgi:hypothetical protein